MGCERIGRAAQGRSGKDCHRVAIASGDNDDTGMDRAAVANGHEDAPGAPFVPRAAEQMKKHDTIDRPLLGEQELTDVTIHGSRTRMRGVKALNVEWRPWIAGFSQCPALNHYQIIHVGI